MHFSYIKKAKSPAAMPCRLTNPLTALYDSSSHGVLILQAPTALPEDFTTAVIMEVAVFNKVKSLLYCPGNTSIMRNMMMQMEDVAKCILQPRLLCLTGWSEKYADAMKPLERAPLYLNNLELTAAEILEELGKIGEGEYARMRIVMIEELLAIKGLRAWGEIHREAAQAFLEGLKRAASDKHVSFVVMTASSLTNILPCETIQPAYVTLKGKEYKVDTILMQ